MWLNFLQMHFDMLKNAQQKFLALYVAWYLASIGVLYWHSLILSHYSFVATDMTIVHVQDARPIYLFIFYVLQYPAWSRNMFYSYCITHKTNIMLRSSFYRMCT